MNSATKIIATIAVVSIGTTALLTAATQPAEQTTGAAPAVVDEALMQPAVVEGSMARQPQVDVALEPFEWPDGSLSQGRHQEGDRLETDDPRLSGLVVMDLYSVFQGGPTGSGMFWGQQRVENEDGTWQGSITGAGTPFGRMDMHSTLTGEGDYEGLFAVVYYTANGTMPATVHGAILAGEPPPIE